MSSNPLGDAFYDDDGLSVTNSEPSEKPSHLSEASNQPYYSNAHSPRPIQPVGPPEADSPVQRFEPDDRYVQPERALRPKQAAPTPQAAPDEPSAVALPPSRLARGNFERASIKPAVIVTKPLPGQGKLSKARAAARLAANPSTATPGMMKLTAPVKAEAPTEPVEKKEQGEIKAPRHIADPTGEGVTPERAISKAPVAKAKTPKPLEQPIAVGPKISAATSAETETTELSKDHTEREPIERRSKAKARMSSADKLRAQRGIRTSKINR